MSELKGLKLTSGEEVLGKVREELDYFVVDNPVMVGVMPEGVMLMPWPQWSSGKQAIIGKSHVLSVFDINAKIAEGYNQKFGGIVTVPAGALHQLQSLGR